MAYGIQPFVCFGFSKISVTWEFWNQFLFQWCELKAVNLPQIDSVHYEPPKKFIKNKNKKAKNNNK